MTRLQLEAETLRIPFRDPFRISRDMSGDVAVTVIVRLTTDRDRVEDRLGLGEGFPDTYYGENPDTMAVVMRLLLEAADPFEPRLGRDVAETRAALEAASAAMDEAIRHHGAAKCAVDIALHDLAARRLGIPVYELLELSPDIPPTDFTIGIDAPDVVGRRAARAARFPALKIKVGGPADLETLEAVRSVYGGPIRVDANTGWIPEQAVRLIPELQRLGVVLVEQPFPAHRLDQLRWLQERSPLPIVADESCVTYDDLEGLVGVVEGVNVKLAKCGGVGPARRMLLRARELGFRRFLGCMEETSVGIAASAAVASLADWVDLDGALLLADDPFEGLALSDDCTWRLSDRPGLGVAPRAASGV
ncbi:MAG: dipeptide epimerase [Chloroflexi bacterium]|nr:dipeptide epimerase [Chloroflexota bacterium]